MGNEPMAIFHFPRAILHIDGDAFFASCEQSRNPQYRGKPLITGKERGIVASMSYEAKALGITRAMRLLEAKKACPELIMLPSDYETYSLLSKRFYAIVKRYTPDVEEYSIDECFADLTGLRRPFRMPYIKIAEAIKRDLDTELGFTFSVGLGPNKVVAKIGSKWKKPSGLTAIPGNRIHKYIENLSVDKLWGIGPATTAFLAKQNIFTALQFARRQPEWIRHYFPRPIFDIWEELHGKYVIPIDTKPKESYESIQKMKTFSPASNDPAFVFSQLSKNIENATMKVRRYKLAAAEAVFFLRTQQFEDYGVEVRLSRPTAAPNDFIKMAEVVYPRLFRAGSWYRSTGVVLFNLVPDQSGQLDLFGASVEIQKMQKLYRAVDQMRAKFGKHTLYLGSSHYANKFAQHVGERGDTPERKSSLLRGESRRRHLGIPMFMGEVS